MTQKIKLTELNKFKLQQALSKAINDINVINSTFNIEDKEIMIPEWLLSMMSKDEVNMIVKKDYNIDTITKLYLILTIVKNLMKHILIMKILLEIDYVKIKYNGKN